MKAKKKVQPSKHKFIKTAGTGKKKATIKRTFTARRSAEMTAQIAKMLADAPEENALLAVHIPDPSKPRKDVQLWTVINTLLPITRRTLLYGPPATGKTHIATHIHMKSRPVFSITLTESTPDAELRGHFVPAGGDFKWMDGPAIKAWREGGCLVLNEINRASADALSLCYVILDDPKTARITLPTGETVTPHPDFRAVATMNGDPKELPEALQDRFPVTIEVKETNPKAFEALPKDLREVAQKTADLEATRRITMRSWMAFAENVYMGGADPDIAGHAIFREKWNDIRAAVLLKMAQAKLALEQKAASKD